MEKRKLVKAKVGNEFRRLMNGAGLEVALGFVVMTARI